MAVSVHTPFPPGSSTGAVERTMVRGECRRGEKYEQILENKSISHFIDFVRFYHLTIRELVIPFIRHLTCARNFSYVV